MGLLGRSDQPVGAEGESTLKWHTLAWLTEPSSRSTQQTSPAGCACVVDLVGMWVGRKADMGCGHGWQLGLGALSGVVIPSRVWVMP